MSENFLSPVLIAAIAVIAAVGQYALRFATLKSADIGWFGLPVMSAVAVTCALYASASRLSPWCS